MQRDLQPLAESVGRHIWRHEPLFGACIPFRTLNEVRCSVLQCVAVCCSVLQCVAVIPAVNSGVLCCASSCMSSPIYMCYMTSLLFRLYV